MTPLTQRFDEIFVIWRSHLAKDSATYDMDYSRGSQQLKVAPHVQLDVFENWPMCGLVSQPTLPPI